MAGKKKILLIGATGSIGDSTLAVIRTYSGLFELVGVVAGKNAEKLANIVNEFNVKYAAIADKEFAGVLQDNVNCKCNTYVGCNGIIELIKAVSADICVSAIVGSDGLLPTITAAQQGMDIALANKESLVAAGDLLMKVAKEHSVSILPVDSEHSGILQCLCAGRKEEIEKVIITASGGAFRDATKNDIMNATPEMALKHPTWNMGKKITIDCATLANKGLEIIEAYWLFGVDFDSIEVLIHRESIIHAMVEYRDGSVIAQMAMPDMSLPVLHALTYPKRIFYPAKRVNFSDVGKLSFKSPDLELFPMLKLAYEVGREGLLAPAVYSAANEEAVKLFLAGKISFMHIARSTEYALTKINTNLHVTLNNILSVEEEAHAYVRDFSGKM